MKKRELEKELSRLGWWLKRQGGNHEIWTNGEDTEPVPRHREIKEHLAKKRGFNSRCEYEEELAEKRSWRKKNKRFSRALKMFLSDNERSQSWLAEQLGVSHQLISLYIQGKLIPQEKILGRLLEVISSNGSTRIGSLDDLVGE